MQNVLVTGGAGFIGSHLCKRLLDENYQVICIDNFISSDRRNISSLEQNPNFKLIEFDLTQSISNFKFPISNFQYIFHLASPASPNANSPRSYINFPVETLMINSYGTKQMLDLAKENNARFLYASSSEVYGDPSVSPQPETYWGNVNPDGPRSVYDEGKRFGEAVTMAYVRKYNIDARIVRIFNTYGPNMQADDGRVVSNFIIQSLKSDPLTVYGKGEQTRSFSYVSDTVDGIWKLMFTENIAGQVVNIGNPTEKTIAEFAQLIKQLTGSNSEIVYQELPEDDPKIRRPDISKAKELLGFEPQVSLEEGLKKTIEYFKQPASS